MGFDIPQIDADVDIKEAVLAVDGKDVHWQRGANPSQKYGKILNTLGGAAGRIACCGLFTRKLDVKINTDIGIAAA